MPPSCSPPLNLSVNLRVSTSELRFADLVTTVRSCRACPRMEGRRRVLGPKNGSLDARLMVVATAPGRRGAERTGVPLCGDASGRTFEQLLTRAGLRRQDVFITNAVLCNPQDRAGRNTEPSTDELRNCRLHLARTLDLVHAPLVIALGRTAFAALIATGDEHLRFEDCLGKRLPWRGRTLAAVCHPSPRVSNTPARYQSLISQWDAAISALTTLEAADQMKAATRS